MFRDLLNLFIDAEIQHPEFGKETSRVFIIGRNSLLHNCISKVEDAIYEHGSVKHCLYYVGQKDYGILCKVEYTFTSQAVAAALLMSGMSFRGTGILSVIMKQSEKDKSIIRTVEHKINGIAFSRNINLKQ